MHTGISIFVNRILSETQAPQNQYRRCYKTNHLLIYKPELRTIHILQKKQTTQTLVWLIV